MNKRFYISLFLFILPHIVCAQDSVKTFFPYQAGDFWVYQEYSQIKQEVVNEIKYRVYADSTDSSGTRWVHIETDNNSTVDSVYYKVHENGDVYFTEYYDVELKGLKQEETDFDENWVGGEIDFSGSEEEYAVFTLKGLEHRSFMGEPREDRIISLTATNDTTTRGSGIEIYEDTWTEDFGVTGRGLYEGGNQWSMKGVYKEGIAYGDTTFNQIVVDTLRSDYFPFETGDFWVYTIVRDFGDENKEKVKYRVYTDSMDTDSTKWVYIEKNVNGQMDSVYYKVTKDGDIYSDDFVGTEMLKFKYNDVSEDDYWAGGQLENGMYGVYELSNVGIYDMVNTPQSVSESRNVNFYEMENSTCCNSRKLREHWVAGFGIDGIRFFDDPDVEAWSFAGIYKDGQVYGDTTFAVITSNEHSSSVPTSFKLRQNYPNPFNPSTTITFEVDQSTEINVTIYSVTGQMVQRLIQDWKYPAGVHRIPFHADKLTGISSGMYLYELRTAHQVIVKKMTLIK